MEMLINHQSVPRIPMHGKWGLYACGDVTFMLDRYAACFLSIMGASPIGPLELAWAIDNAAPDTMRAVTSAIIPGPFISSIVSYTLEQCVLGFGALGSVIAVVSYSYRKGG